jgi:hypothetical protein
MSALERLLALGQWRWTPLVGLTAGSAAVVLSLWALVPDRIGTVLAPPPRRSAPLPIATPEPSSGEEETTDVHLPSPTAMRPNTPATVAPVERRRGFSPVIREDVPTPSEPPPQMAEAEPPAPEPDIANADGDERERWRRGQAIGARAASRAAMRASALAGRVARAKAHGATAAEGVLEGEAPAENTSGNTLTPLDPPGREPAATDPATSEPAVSE